MESTIFKILTEYGLAGILAGGMFYFYIKREKDIVEDEKKRTEFERQAKLDYAIIIKENTTAITRLCEKLEKG